MSYQATTVADLEPRVPAGSYREFLRREGMSLGLYRLAAGGSDGQHPHAADEVYVVMSGRATLIVDDAAVPVGPGSVVSVDRGVDHRFTDIAEELTLVVVFAPPSVPQT